MEPHTDGFRVNIITITITIFIIMIIMIIIIIIMRLSPLPHNRAGATASNHHTPPHNNSCLSYRSTTWLQV
jgi:hypothetical protein